MQKDQSYKGYLQKMHQPRVETFGDLITAGHKVLNEEPVSRNIDSYAVIVQD